MYNRKRYSRKKNKKNVKNKSKVSRNRLYKRLNKRNKNNKSKRKTREFKLMKQTKRNKKNIKNIKQLYGGAVAPYDFRHLISGDNKCLKLYITADSNKYWDKFDQYLSKMLILCPLLKIKSDPNIEGKYTSDIIIKQLQTHPRLASDYVKVQDIGRSDGHKRSDYHVLLQTLLDNMKIQISNDYLKVNKFTTKLSDEEKTNIILDIDEHRWRIQVGTILSYPSVFRDSKINRHFVAATGFGVNKEYLQHVGIYIGYGLILEISARSLHNLKKTYKLKDIYELHRTIGFSNPAVAGFGVTLLSDFIINAQRRACFITKKHIKPKSPNLDEYQKGNFPETPWEETVSNDIKNQNPYLQVMGHSDRMPYHYHNNKWVESFLYRRNPDEASEEPYLKEKNKDNRYWANTRLDRPRSKEEWTSLIDRGINYSKKINVNRTSYFPFLRDCQVAAMEIKFGNEQRLQTSSTKKRKNYMFYRIPIEIDSAEGAPSDSAHDSFKTYSITNSDTINIKNIQNHYLLTNLEKISHDTDLNLDDLINDWLTSDLTELSDPNSQKYQDLTSLFNKLNSITQEEIDILYGKVNITQEEIDILYGKVNTNTINQIQLYDGVLEELEENIPQKKSKSFFFSNIEDKEDDGQDDARDARRRAAIQLENLNTTEEQEDWLQKKAIAEIAEIAETALG